MCNKWLLANSSKRDRLKTGEETMFRYILACPKDLLELRLNKLRGCIQQMGFRCGQVGNRRDKKGVDVSGFEVYLGKANFEIWVPRNGKESKVFEYKTLNESYEATELYHLQASAIIEALKACELLSEVHDTTRYYPGKKLTLLRNNWRSQMNLIQKMKAKSSGTDAVSDLFKDMTKVAESSLRNNGSSQR
jgi:hypothetical protein